MVRFSCFLAHNHSHKQKKTVQMSAEAMQKQLEDCSQNRSPKDFTSLAAATPSNLKIRGDNVESGTDNVSDSSPIDRDCRSEEIESKYFVDHETGVSTNTHMKKSRSLGNVLNWEHRFPREEDLGDENERISCDGSHNHCGSAVLDGAKEFIVSPPHQFQEAARSDYFQLNSDLIKSESNFSFGDIHQSEKEGCDQNSDAQLSGASESADHTPRIGPIIIKSRSLPNLHSPGRSLSFTIRRARSLKDRGILDSGWKESLIHDIETEAVKLQEKDHACLDNGKRTCQNPADDTEDAYNYVGSAKDWVMPVGDEGSTRKDTEKESLRFDWKELPSTNSRMKRIQEWVMDLQHLGPPDESNNISTSNEESKGKSVLDALPQAKLEDKLNPGMEAVKKYISSLSANTSSAQLMNHGLIMIPFLSSFVTLKAINFSGNGIVRITVGSLPRGLHVLNLSRNKISNIEGLRELTRLRILDLSYNRILRIGHGLASCSSLKELYLAGNKISEVEGLHRLLKLNVLDLRFNKISTTKCLGQLAANYNSLQAISLEGNPAQKNVGDEQLKKYLLGLLPHLTYFNRQPIKTDGADRSTRLGISSHLADRGYKAELKSMRKGSHGVAGQKLSSIHGHKVQQVGLPKVSRSKHGRIPLSSTRPTAERHHILDFSSKLTRFRPELSIHKSCSEGNLGAL